MFDEKKERVKMRIFWFFVFILDAYFCVVCFVLFF